MRRTVAAAMDVLILFWGLGIGPLCWIVRDGLGPDTVDSHGLDAVVRFLFTFWWGPILAALVAIRLLVRRWGSRNRSRPTSC